MNANSAILAGRYGEPCESHGEVKENYLWYFPYIGNARNALYTGKFNIANQIFI